MADEDDELLDLVDANDHAIGTVLRSQAYVPGGRPAYSYLRATSCFIMNQKQQLWIPRRQPHKKIKPNALDFSAGGHVSSGEDYAPALLREIIEETGIQAELDDLQFIAKQIPSEVPPYIYFQAIYLLRTDTVNNYSHDDFSGFEWLTIAELQKRLKDGELAKDSIDYSLNQLSAYLGQHDGDHERDK
jgi:isopentenyl-diphosphate delta-isomerase